MAMPCDVLYFSPHLDDVVLSCPGQILADRAGGESVLVATLFSRGGTDADSLRLYEARRAEDQQALSILDVEGLHLGLSDAPFRNPYYRSFRAIVLGEHPNDALDACLVNDVVKKTWQEYHPRRCYFPLGVGTHIDHRLTHAAAATLPPDAQVAFYEDRPYAFLRHNVRTRLSELGARLNPEELPPDLRPLPDEVLIRSFRASLDTTAYVRAYLPPGDERTDCEQRLLDALVTRHSLPDLAIRPRILTTTAEQFERVFTAVSAYGTQIGDLFGTMDGYRRQTREYAEYLGVSASYAERVWDRRR